MLRECLESYIVEGENIRTFLKPILITMLSYHIINVYRTILNMFDNLERLEKINKSICKNLFGTNFGIDGII